jgi:hypothetical protein
VPGDNIAVCGGPPISLAWEHQDEFVYDLKVYEERIQDYRQKKGGIIMRSKIRYQHVKESGLSPQDIRESRFCSQSMNKKAHEDLEKFDRQMEDEEKKRLKGILKNKGGKHSKCVIDTLIHNRPYPLKKNKGGKNNNYVIDALIHDRPYLFPLFLISITLISIFFLAVWNSP